LKIKKKVNLYRFTFFLIHYVKLMKQKPNQRDSEGRLHGVWEIYRSDDTLSWRGHYHHGQRHGLWEDYRSDGTLWRRGHYHHGKEHCLWESYYSDGTLCQRRHFHHGQRHGIWEGYWPDGTLRWRVFYNMENQVGLEEKWDEKGNLTYSKDHGGQVPQKPEFSSASSGPISKSLDFVMPDPSDMFAPITRDF
jgi:hypothetical protein